MFIKYSYKSRLHFSKYVWNHLFLFTNYNRNWSLTHLWNGQKLGIISSWGFSVNEHKLNGCFDRGKLLSGMRSKDKAFQQNFLVNPSYQKIDEILARQCSTGLEPQHSEWRAGETAPSSRSTPPTERNSKTKGNTECKVLSSVPTRATLRDTVWSLVGV